MSNPLCPVTGAPAVRHVQWVRSRFLVDLWRYGIGVDARSSFGEVHRFGLWESPVGLYFFDPMVEGDHAFYTQFYDSLVRRGLWSRKSVRREFELAAQAVKPGDSVLDVGCGFAEFRRLLPHARYVGLDPHFAEGSGIEGVRNESLCEHLVDHAGSYDVVCAFQVIEHLKSPVELFADMVRAVKPGGLLVVGVPHVPSALTRIPNHLTNAPPHHLTWWTKQALGALAERCGAEVARIDNAPWGDYDALMYWMEQCSPIRCRDVFYRNRVSWHAAAIIGLLVGRVMYALRGVPTTTDEGAGLVMFARRRA